VEIDLSQFKGDEKYIWSSLALILLVLLTLLGRHYTVERRLLTWQEWQIQKAEKIHRTEWETLSKQAERLAVVLAEEPEPVRAALIARNALRSVEQIESLTLQDEKAVFQQAAQTVIDWSIGAVDYNTAVNAVMSALQVIENGR